jgi:hypothetical protein
MMQQINKFTIAFEIAPAPRMGRRLAFMVRHYPAAFDHGLLVRGQVWRPHDGRHWIYKKHN